MLTFADPGGSYNYYSFQARMKEYVNEDDPLESFYYSLHSVPYHNLVDDTLFDGSQEVVFSDEFYVLDGSITEKIILCRAFYLSSWRLSFFKKNSRSHRRNTRAVLR